MTVWWLLWACGGGGEPVVTPPAPPPAPVAPVAAHDRVVPEVAFSFPKRTGTSPALLPMDPTLQATRELLHRAVMDHARDPENPWAVVHGMLALGVAEKLTNGADPVDWLFEHYALVVDVQGTPLLQFPSNRGKIRIEPHTDLILKALAEGGVPPSRQVTVDGRLFQVAELYRGSLSRSWIKGTTTSFQESGFNDTPWALQAFATWAPEELAWKAPGGRDMTLDGFTDAEVDVLVHETRAMREARAAGQVLQKDVRQGLFGYTCGGQHLVMGAAYAVARGYGRPENRATMCEQKDLLRWRIDVELAALDPYLASGQLDLAMSTLLLGQRLKFLGHWLETTHKILAMELCPPTDADREATARVAHELVRTVQTLDSIGIWKDLGGIPTDPRFASLPDRGPDSGAIQLYLDLVGDSAHAVRGIDLATGAGTIAW